MALLWPERDLPNARRLLNLAVHVLRAALGEDAIHSVGEALLWNPAVVECDLHSLRAAITSGVREHSAEIVRWYAGPLLDAFFLPESNEFSYWLDQERAQLAHAYLGALLDVANRQLQAGEIHGLVDTRRKLVAIDPHSTQFALAMMRALDDYGDRAAAIRHAAEHAKRRRADLDLDANPEVIAFAERLRSSRVTRRPALPTHFAPRSAAIAVLPFAQLGTDSSTEVFAEGVTEDVIAHLAKIQSLRVIARASVAPFRDGLTSFRDIGRQLSVAFILHGTVRHAGGRVRIVATLTHAEREELLWSETYDRQLTDIFAIQTDVALHIAKALRAGLTGEEKVRVRREPTGDVEAYRLLLQGRQWFAKFNPEAFAHAIDYCKRAIARDPSFALAYSQLAGVYVEQGEGGSVPARLVQTLAAEAVEQALRLDPELAAAHCTAAHLKMVAHFDWEGAEASFQRAIELAPSYSDAYDLYGRLCAALTRYDDAIALQQVAFKLDPLVNRLDVATTLLRAGRYEEALARAANVVELEPNYDRALATLGWAHFLLGRRDEGIALLERAVSVRPSALLWLAQLGEAYGLNGESGKAREVLQTLEARAQQGFVSPYHFAYVYTGLGDRDRALDWVERAIDERAGGAYSIKGSFLLMSLHSHPRFPALLQRIRLT